MTKNYSQTKIPEISKEVSKQVILNSLDSDNPKIDVPLLLPKTKFK